ncbi:hypothetical protein PMKS-002085 [Pichia membranifaciens]|uniref:Uncharacterized protein n=1 Tax=Pichia membranifaciens TaxID=4926 RepID=A0A1Q2YGE3_9ASCO|nr:hypothetical protein PMKS-002085 [Pichia membranifaciens]
MNETTDLNDLSGTIKTSSIHNNTSILLDSTESLINNIPNSIFELVKNVNYRKKSTTTSLLSINSTSTVISLNGPTSKDIPPTKLTSVEQVSDSDFEKYLDELDENYDEFSSSKLLTTSSLSKLEKCNNNHPDDPGLNSSTHGSLNPLNEEQEAMLESNNLTNVPDIYFNEDFKLDNPRIFNKVVENARFLTLIDDDSDSAVVSNKTMVDHEALQDKLSSYLDIVEVHLIHEISKSSDNFFSALDDLKKITNSSKFLTDQLQNVDSQLSDIRSQKILNAKNLLQLVQKYQNIQKFDQVLVQIKTILQQADLAETAYYKGSYDHSLQLIDSVFAMTRGNVPPHPMIDALIVDWKFPLSDLNRLPALIPLKRLLSNLITDTGKSYAKLFSNFLIDDLRAKYENISTFKILQRLLGDEKHVSANESYSVISDDFRTKIMVYLKGLTRCGELSSAFKLYEERLSNELKSIFKSNLPTDGSSNPIESNRSDDSRSTNITSNINNALILSDLVKNMTPKEFENMLVDDYTKFSETFRRLTIHKNLLLTTSIDALNSFDPQILKVQPDMIMELDITNSISYSINSIQRRMAKLIRIREQQNSSIPLNYFPRFYKLNMSFLTECEIVSKGMVNDPVLKDVVNRQLMIFIQQFHKESMKRCIRIVETEIWKDDGLPIESQLTLDLITRSAEGNVEDREWTEGLGLDFADYNEDNKVGEKPNDGSNTEATTNDDQIEIRKTLNLHSQNYILPSSVGAILSNLRAYLLLVHYFKNNINNVISQSYLPELLKAINLKIHQSVLGAQATKTAGLKHITTKHLALAGEVCRFWSVIVADIERACLSEINNGGSIGSKDGEQINKVRKAIMKEFEEVRGLFGEQVVDVYDKLVAIMRDTTLALVQGLKVANFLNPEAGEDSVNSYMESIVKKTLTIARSVQRYLPAEEYDGVLLRIFGEYEKILSGKYNEILEKCASDKETTLKVKKQIWRDIKFFGAKLDDDNAGDTVRKLLDFIGFDGQDSQTETRQEAKLESDSITPDPEVGSNVEVEIAAQDVSGKAPNTQIDVVTALETEKEPTDESKDVSAKISQVEPKNSDELDYKDQTASDGPEYEASNGSTNGAGHGIINVAKEETNNQLRNDSEGSLKSIPKNGPENDLKSDPKNDGKDDLKSDPKNDGKDDPKSDPKNDGKDDPKCDSNAKDDPKGNSKSVPENDAKDDAKDDPNDTKDDATSVDKNDATDDAVDDNTQQTDKS